MKNFKVIEKSRLNEFTMAKLIGGRPCNERNTNCGATGYSCNAAFGISDPCGNFRDGTNCPRNYGTCSPNIEVCPERRLPDLPVLMNIYLFCLHHH